MLLHVVNNSTKIEHVKGKPKSFRSRYIRDIDRLDLGTSVSDMSYPSKEFHRRLANLDEKCFLAGNLKDVPMSKSDVKQCAYEYQLSILVDEYQLSILVDEYQLSILVDEYQQSILVDRVSTIDISL